jgi:hypothetical protein
MFSFEHDLFRKTGTHFSGSCLRAQLLMSDDQVFSIILTTLSGIGM